MKLNKTIYNILAIIPARIGSKGLKHKNLLKIGNKELVQHAIDQCKQSKLINSIAMSTDSKKIQNIAKKNNVWCEKLRSKKISNDTAKLYHAIKFTINNIDKKFDFIVEIHPTYIFRSPKLIDQAINFLINNKNLDSIISVKEIKDTSHPDYVIKINNKKINFKKTPTAFNRHKLNKRYYSMGLILISKYKSFIKNKSMVGNSCGGFIIKNNLPCLDINNIDEFKYAKYIYENKIYLRK